MPVPTRCAVRWPAWCSWRDPGDAGTVTYPVGIFPTKDGWIGLDDLARPEFTMGIDRFPHADAFEARFIPKLRERSAREWFARALELRLPIVVVPRMADVLASPEFLERGAIVPVRFGAIQLEAPALPLHMAATPPRPGREVPRLGGSRVEPRATPPFRWCRRGRVGVRRRDGRRDVGGLLPGDRCGPCKATASPPGWSGRRSISTGTRILSSAASGRRSTAPSSAHILSRRWRSGRGLSPIRSVRQRRRSASSMRRCWADCSVSRQQSRRVWRRPASRARRLCRVRAPLANRRPT